MRKTEEGLTILILGAIAVGGAFLVPAPPEGETWAGVLPMGAAISLTLTGALMLWTEIREGGVPAGREMTSALPAEGTFLKVMALFALGIVYHQLILKFGYHLSTACVGPAALYIFGVRNKVGLSLSAILFPLVFHLLFFKLLGVFPPFGELFDLMDYLRG